MDRASVSEVRNRTSWRVMSTTQGVIILKKKRIPGDCKELTKGVVEAPSPKA